MLESFPKAFLKQLRESFPRALLLVASKAPRDILLEEMAVNLLRVYSSCFLGISLDVDRQQPTLVVITVVLS